MNEKKRKQIQELIELNPDARQYFFSEADERWLDWLWANGFLDVVKEKAKDPTRHGYGTPELNYLVKVAEKVPAKVVNIMLAVPISVDTFNPEVLHQFLRICASLPTTQLRRIVSKLRDEKWVQLMGAFNDQGFKYREMFQVLSNAGDYESMLVLAEAVLSVRSKEEIEKTTIRTMSDNPFYFSDLSHTKVFEHLASVDDEHAEMAFRLVTNVMAQVVRLGCRTKGSEILLVEETYHLLDVDFFTLEPGQKKHYSHLQNVRELAAVIKVLASKLIGRRCSEVDTVWRIYDQSIRLLPQSRAMWRLRLFVLSLCPAAFSEELKNAFFRLFEVQRYYEITSGTEYEKALQKGFSALSQKERREYVRRVIEYFGKHAEDNERQDWHIRHGSEILSMIADHLTSEEKRIAEEAGFELDPIYEPKPSFGETRGGWVKPRGPTTQEEFGKLTLADIADLLRSDWAPGQLSKQNTTDDFLNPLNAEGVAELLKKDISERLQDYVDNAHLFFEKDVLDQHYTYSFLQGIKEVIKSDKSRAATIKWEGLIALCTAIKESGEGRLFDRKERGRDTFDAWLAGWTAVHSALADVIQALLGEDSGKTTIRFPEYRGRLLAIIHYLLTYPDPIPKDEDPRTATTTVSLAGSEEELVGDPFTMAINTVRGRAFQALALFVYQDEKQFPRETQTKLSSDVKRICNAVLRREDTRALMFMFGYYLPTFYFRDIEWARALLPQIFPTEALNRHLYLAAWEGYLENDLFEEMFFEPDFQKLYERGLALTGAEDAKRQHFRDPDERIAEHLALAFVLYETFGFEHSLFKSFWENGNAKRHAAFVSFLGRLFVSGANDRASDLLEKEPKVRQRLRDLWDWLLANHTNPTPFVEFGSWMSLEKDIFEPQWLALHINKTLEKTKGTLDWDYGLTKSIVKLAENDPEDTLAIARLYLLEGAVRGSEQPPFFDVDDQWVEALQVLYRNPSTKSGTERLIAQLIQDGGNLFWKLKKVIGDESTG